MSNNFTINVTVPIEVGAYVYRNSDIATLYEHTSYYISLKKYQVIGYEIVATIVSSVAETVVGNAVLKCVAVGGVTYTDNYHEYVNTNLLTISTDELEAKILAIATVN